ncbi:ribosome maturation factor RimP [Demequina capsici]|uniref:Ribosome maturation factor RimP n=1 Tax=Demequina capsici TaxID=3075620 RepID=A0AA96F5C3_9MICO|nr:MULTISPECIES: ribosome maturation factor RimP [unclassified Demequina]WNM23408.1 ribosome maturation factor RimP [Demequina sp. OYTSA14]WNM26285.1 ribosome maturation factor RimP [Demequina sp. PMTSA13]
MDITERIADLAAPAAEAAGLVLDGVEVHPGGKRSRVVVTVDLPETEVGSADLDSIADASRGIGKALDEADVMSGEYLLEVSTPGTSRPLTERRHFMRARTRLVVIDLVSGDQARGRLVEVSEDAVVLDGAAGEVTVPMANIARGEIELELKRIEED